MTTQINNIRYILKKDKNWRNRFLKARIGLYLIFSVMTFVSSISFGYFNIFYFIQSILKYVVCFSIFMAGIYLLVGEKETAENWQKAGHAHRKINFYPFAPLFFLQIQNL